MSNSFVTFEIPVAFNIDIDYIGNKFIEFQKKHHPDSNTYSNANFILDITNAYYILIDDIKRGNAILDIFNVDQNSIQMPDNFLENIFDLDEHVKLSMTEEYKNNLMKYKTISSKNIEQFATDFMCFKYIKSSL